MRVDLEPPRVDVGHRDRRRERAIGSAVVSPTCSPSISRVTVAPGSHPSPVAFTSPPGVTDGLSRARARDSTGAARSGMWSSARSWSSWSSWRVRSSWSRPWSSARSSVVVVALAVVVVAFAVVVVGLCRRRGRLGGRRGRHRRGRRRRRGGGDRRGRGGRGRRRGGRRRAEHREGRAPDLVWCPS